MDFIQLREKDLPIRELEMLAKDAVQAVRGAGTPTRLLINSRTDVAIASLADGVHLRSDDAPPDEVHVVCRLSQPTRPATDPVIAVSCHNDEEIERTASSSATFAVLAPIFEKDGSRPAGMQMLARVCRNKIPVLALGGVTLDNFQSCLSAGAAGIAGIRLFQAADLRHTVAKLRESH